jgi:FtsP/CotA-like multicopper oxidase with cupredoxin domain
MAGDKEDERMQSNGARAGLLVVLAAAAVVLFVALSGGDDDSGGDETTSATSTATTATATEPAPPPPTAQIAIKDDAPVGGVEQIEVTKGDRVVLEVSSDAAGELHVHGYELEQELTPGKTATLRFPADIDGKFEIELHAASGAHAPVAELTVQPG